VIGASALVGCLVSYLCLLRLLRLLRRAGVGLIYFDAPTGTGGGNSLVFYWLFTEGRAALGGCLAPLLCLIPLTPVIAAALMGASIRRTDQDKQNTRRDLVLRLLAHLIVTLGIAALYLALMGDFAIRRATVPQVADGFIASVTGGPADHQPDAVVHWPGCWGVW